MGFYSRRPVKNFCVYLGRSILPILSSALNTLNLGNKGHWNLAQLVLTLILLTILTSFDPKPDPYFQPRNLVRHNCKLVFLSRDRLVLCNIFFDKNEENVDSLRHKKL